MNSISVSRYAEQIHLFEPWTPPAYDKQKTTEQLIEEAIRALSEYLGVGWRGNRRQMLEFFLFMDKWKPQPGEPVNDAVARALLSQRKHQQIVSADDPCLALKCTRKWSHNYSVDALVEYTDGGEFWPAAHLAGPDAYLDYETIKAQLGRKLHPCEAVAVRGYCLACKYLILAEKPKKPEAGTTIGQERTALQAYYANIFQAARELGAKTVALTPMIAYVIDQDDAIRICLAQINRELAQSPDIEHTVLYTSQPTILRKYEALLMELQEGENK